MQEVRNIEREISAKNANKKEVELNKKLDKGKHATANGIPGISAKNPVLAMVEKEKSLGKSSMAYCWHTNSGDGPEIHEYFWPHHYIDYFVGTSTGG